MKLNSYFHQHFNTGGKQLPGTFLKVGFQQAVDIIPNHPPCFGYEIITTRIFLHKFQITMPRRIGTDIAQLCLYPIFIGQALLQTTAHECIQF